MYEDSLHDVWKIFTFFQLAGWDDCEDDRFSAYIFFNNDNLINIFIFFLGFPVSLTKIKKLQERILLIFVRSSIVVVPVLM